MNNKILLGVLATGLALGTLGSVMAFDGSTANTQGFGGNRNCPGGPGGQGGPMKAEIAEAISNNDYDAFMVAVADTPFADEATQLVTEEVFAQMVEAHNLMEAGDREAAREIMDNLDLPFMGRGPGHNGDKGGPMNEEMKAALDAGDYNAWVELVTDSPRGEDVLNIINEDNFSRLVEAHELMQAGDGEGAKAIFDELGLQGPGQGKKGPGMHKGFGGNNQNTDGGEQA